MARRHILENNDIVNIDDEKIEIFGNEVKHMQVLRHNIDDEVIINEYICKIIEIKRNSIILKKLKKAPIIGIPKTNLTLFVAVLKNDKLDFVCQKAVELGVSKIVPFFSKNVIVKLDDKSIQKRKEKLKVIANEACKQCGRTDSIEIGDFLKFNDMIECIKNSEQVLFAYEKENKSLKETLNNCNKKNISVIIGPEGGFDEDEAENLMRLENVYSVSLGTRILRAETAALNLVSIVMYEMEE